MIVLDVMCGMGNQMFQYAYARALQEQCDEKIFLTMVTAKRMNDNRSFSLNHCALKDSVSILPVWQQYILDIYFKLKMKFLGKKYTDLDPKEKYELLAKEGIYTTEKIYCYYGFPLCAKRMKYINGWWQTEKYFNSIARQIRRELLIKTPPSEQNIRMLNKIQSGESVCIHVRRGDYVSEKFSNELNICDKQYYRKAIAIIKSKVHEPIFYIFSTSHEDLEWIRNEWRLEENAVYVDLDNSDYEELRLMYSCKHFILANSTFSWWGAYLSQNENKIVIAPKIWNRRDDDFEDIYMCEWMRI